MRTTIRILGLGARLAALLSTLATFAGGGIAQAAPALRVQVDQHGDFLLIGNTLGYDCAAGTPLPVVGTLAAGACSQGANTNISDSSPDLYWSADDPTTGACLADIATPASAARSTAVLTVPVGATITNAFLYWSAVNTTGVADTSVTLQRVGAGAFGPTTITALQSWTSTDKTYQSVADVTSIVQANGSGAYRVSDVDVAPFANVDVSVLFGGWWLVAFYQLPTDPLRNLTLFDGLDVVSATGGNQSVTLSGFLVPNAAGFTGKLGVVAFEGDNTATGDALLFNGVTLSNAQNPADNFFNSTRSWLGAPVSVPGDLPQLTGTAQSMGGVDIDVVDITAELTMGQTSAPIVATTSVPVGDTYYLAGFVTSISTFAQDLSTSTKTAADLNGGILVPGDTLRYTITAVNTGNDTSINTTVTDALPPGVTYVPGSIDILTGPGMGIQTDATDGDRAEYVAGTNTVVARLGTIVAGMGTTLAPGASSSFRFDVKVNASFTGQIANQASISAGGALGGPVTVVLTDGNGSAAGSPPTVVTVSQCMMDSDCGSTTSGMVCDPTDNCIPGCRGMGGNGCPTTMMCSSTTMMIGTCGPIAGTSSSSTAASSSGAATASSSASTGGAATTSSSASTGGAATASSSASSGGAGGMGGAPTTTNVGGVGGGGGFIAVGNGIACNASSRDGSSDGAGWIAGVALAALAGSRRRRRR